MRTLVIGILTGLALVSGPAASAASPTGELFDSETQQAVQRGLAYLASNQRENGSWTCRIGYKLYENYNGEDGEHVGVTALACMAFVSNGHVPGRGRYGRVVERGLRFVLQSVREEDGYITSNGTRMYSHAFATMFLAEIYGMTGRDDVKSRLKRSVALLVAAQNKEGGWRYSPAPIDADLSVTVSILQALRAARNVGISVPTPAIKRATAYVTRCATPYGFSYQPAADYGINDSRITFALTACGIVSLHSAGVYDSEEVKKGVAVLHRRRNELIPLRYHYFYGHYYAAQAMYVAGAEHFRDYYKRVRDNILAHRLPDGGWKDDVGRNYATAMACIILQLPCELLPIFQK